MLHRHVAVTLSIGALLAMACDGGDPYPDAASADASAPLDARADAFVADAGRDATATDSGVECADHHDCAQGEYCHRGACRREALPVYHCGKPGCPPGRWCIAEDGARGTCAEDDAYACDDPCDCGPGFCCVGSRCVRDEADPWLTDGTATASSCRVGPDVPEDERTPTYCATDPECFSGERAWAQSSRRGSFLAYDPATGAPTPVCGGRSCFGTACNCEPGESCVETVDSYVPAGATCGRLSGGSCVSHALAEAVFGWAPAELLSCCSSGCLAGERCEAGAATRGNRFGFERVVATCPGATACVCGDGTCCPDELQSCLADCVEASGSCGDGRCDRFEHRARCPSDCPAGCGDGACLPGESDASCPTDCAEACPDGWCSAAEALSASCPADCDGRCADAGGYNRAYRVCGDGVCDQRSACDRSEPESCHTCPSDCGACEWDVLHRAPVDARLAAHDILAGWVSGPRDELVGMSSGATVTETSLFAREGVTWAPVDLGPSAPTILAIWSDGSIVVAVGHADFNNAAFVRVAGRWLQMEVPAETGTSWLEAVWGSGPSDVFAAGESYPLGSRVYHFDGAAWTQVSGVGLQYVEAGWASGADDVYVVGAHCRDTCSAGAPWGAIWRSGGASWSEVATVDAELRDVWGSGPADVYAVGTGGTVLHFDGAAWAPLSPPTTADLAAVWGTGPSDVYVVGNGVALRFDGSTWSSWDVGVPIPAGASISAWVRADGPEHVLMHAVASDDGGRVTGAIFRRFDGLEWWDAVAPSSALRLEDVAGYEDATPFVIGFRSTLSRTERPVGRFEDGRIHWTDPGFDVYELDARAGGALWGVGGAGGSDGRVAVYESGGWRLVHTSASAFGRLAVLGDDDVYVGGRTVRAEHFDGVGWSLAPADAFGPIVLYVSGWSVSPTGGLVVAGRDRLAFGTYGVAYVEGGVATDVGRGLSTPSGVNVTAVWGSGPDDVYTVQSCDACYGGPNHWFLHYGAGGARTEYRPATRATLFDVRGTGREDVVLAGTGSDGEPYLEVFDGATWRRAAVDLRQAGSHACPGLRNVGAVGGALYVVGDSETIVRRRADTAP